MTGDYLHDRGERGDNISRAREREIRVAAPHHITSQRRLENGGFQRNADSEFCISIRRFTTGIKSAEGENEM